MDLNIILWIGGMFFTLGVFAIKVGFGLAYGRVGAKGIAITIATYIVLFLVIALLSGKLTVFVSPLLAKGPYLHILMAAGLVAWGLYAMARPACTHQTCREDADAAMPSLLLIVPCPVCLAAMIFSTGAALAVIKLPPVLVGTGMGFTFAAFTMLIRSIAVAGKSERTGASLGLVMITIGIYFFASLFLPAKIEAARNIYSSFIDRGEAADINGWAGVLLILLASIGIGYFRKYMEHK